ncbi:MAG TPA: endolytic transglycosylase MltG [Bacilli bacterium]|nr:endolytic transglycosylase MltG [Bacilli bacterium]
MKKTILTLTIILLSLGVIGVGVFFFLLTPVNNNEDLTKFTVEEGSSTRSVITTLKEEDLIRCEYAALIYVKFNSNYNIKAGTYELSSSYGTMKTLKLLNEGNTIEKKGVTVTFIEGKRLTYYADVISENFAYTSSEVLAVLSDKAYLNELINEYWFITDEILNENILYPLEGYLYPDTYNFDTDSSIKTIINKLIYTLGTKIEPYKEEIANSNYTFHEILSLASDVEIEGNNEVDRKLIAGIFLRRLDIGMALGSDVTTYYAVQKNMGEKLYQVDLNSTSLYNTRNSSVMAGKINVGPICNPSIMSIVAVLEPTSSDYLYFYADYLGDNTIYYSETYAEHIATVARFEG